MKRALPPFPHPRAADLSAILGALNIWACAPGDKYRSLALKAALRKYQQAVRAGKYPPMSNNCCNRTAASKEPPQAIPGSFESFFPNHWQTGAGR